MSFANNYTIFNIQEIQDSGQRHGEVTKVNERDFEKSGFINLTPSRGSNKSTSKCETKYIKNEFILDSVYIKKEKFMDFDSNDLNPTKIKVEDYSASEEKLPNVAEVSKREFQLSEQDNLKLATNIKIEKESESEDKYNIVKSQMFATIPEISHISVGEIKIEDGCCDKANPPSEEDSYDIEIQKDENSASTKVIYEDDSDDVDMGSEEEYSSAVSKWNEEDDIPTTSRKIQKLKADLKPKKDKINSPSEDEEFLSDVSDGDESLSDNQILTVDNKPVVSELINEYHKKPQLWFNELSTEMNDSKELQLFRSINKTLSKKFNMKFHVGGIKTLLKSLFTQYEAEIERQLTENEETTAESSTLWFYDKLFFVKEDIENKIKLKLEKTLEVLDDNILVDLIEIYKNYDSLWDTNNSLYPNKKKRLETMQTMCLEIKSKMEISLNTFKLGFQLLNLHKNLRKEKKFRFTCETKKLEYKPTLFFIDKYEFLENHQAPFKCGECMEILETYQQFRLHKAQHDGTPPFQCNICGIVCKSKENFYSHNYRHNGINYICSICGKEFTQPTNLSEHIKIIHMPKMFNCDICGKSFHRPCKVERHKKQVHEEEPVECKKCGKIYKNQISFIKHNYAHNEKPSACTICGKNFKRATILKRHMEHIHTFKCEICDEVCADKKGLNQHIASHEGKQFNCNICGKGFDDQQKVKQHELRTHAQKEIQCKVCGQVFKGRHPLYYHRFTHDDKKYDCNICGKNFSHPTALNMHIPTHNKQYKCNFCGKSYALIYTLRRHVEVCKDRRIKTNI